MEISPEVSHTLFFFSPFGKWTGGFLRAKVCLPWSHCSKEGHSSNAEFLKCLQAALLGASMCVNITSRCFLVDAWALKWITLSHNRILSLWLCHARSQAHCSLSQDCGTGQRECVSWYWCERYRPWIGQSVFGSAEIKTGPAECSTHSVSLSVPVLPTISHKHLLCQFILDLILADNSLL